MGEHISLLLSTLKDEYLEELKRILGGIDQSAEVQTDTGLDLRNRLRGPLGLTGEHYHIAYAIGIIRDGFFRGDDLIQRFLHGEEGVTAGANATVISYNIRPFSVRRLVDLLMESRKSALVRPMRG